MWPGGFPTALPHQPTTIGEKMNEEPQNAEFVQLLTSHQRRLYLYILTLLPDPNDAEDVLSDDSTLLWSKSDEFEPGTNFTAWAYRVAHFEVLAFRKRSAREPRYFSDDLLDTFATEQDDRDEQYEDRLSAMRVCMTKSKPADRELIARRYMPGVSVADIASESGRSSGSIYRSLERIRTALLECIRRRLAAQQHEDKK